MIQIRLIDGTEHKFHDAVTEWDEHILQVVYPGQRWTFPLTAVAYFVTDEATP